MIKDLNVRPEKNKIYKENQTLDTKLLNIGFRSIFVILTPREGKQTKYVNETTSNSKLIHSKRNYKQTNNFNIYQLVNGNTNKQERERQKIQEIADLFQECNAKKNHSLTIIH